jgi:hypothetical protein
MKILKEFFLIKRVNRLTSNGKRLLIKYHYSKSYRSNYSHCFYLHNKIGILLGVALFGTPTSLTVLQKNKKSIELKKFVLKQKAPKNFASYFLSKCIKYLKNEKKYDKIITYADPNQGHLGTIYKSTNFLYLGQGKCNYFYHNNNRIFSERQMYQKNKYGFYINSALDLQKQYKSGQLIRKKHEGKYIFSYKL